MNAKTSFNAVPGITFFPTVAGIDVVAVLDDENKTTLRTELVKRPKDRKGQVSCSINGELLLVSKAANGDLKLELGGKVIGPAKPYVSDSNAERWWCPLTKRAEAASAEQALKALFGE